MSRNLQWFLLIIIGGLAGMFIGELLSSILSAGMLKDILSKTVALGIEPAATLDVKFFSLTIGFQLKLTLFGLLGLGLAFYLGKYIR